MTAGGRDTRDGERGQILVMMIISLLAICALVAVAADTGFFFDYRRRMQSGADAAAMAGAWQVHSGDTSGTKVSDAAQKGATSNGFTDGGEGTHVTINWPPLSGPYAAGGSGATPGAGNPGFVEAIITQPRPTIFMAILGFQSATVSARAVAGTRDSSPCILGLDQAPGTNSVNLNGGYTVNASCGVFSNSDLSGGGGGGGGNAQLSATSIGVTGNKSGCCFTPAPTIGVPPVPDPFAGRVAPTFSSTTCDYTNSQSGCDPPSCVTSGTATLRPGVYCDGIKIGSSANVTFAAGVYVINGGGLQINGGGGSGATVNGTGVTFYNTATSGHTYGRVDINGATGTLSAPTSGPMEAMLFFQDRTITPSGSAGNNVINGGGTLGLQGTLYFPTTNLAFAGNNNPTRSYIILIADTIKFSGGASLTNDFSSLSSGSPVKDVALAE